MQSAIVEKSQIKSGREMWIDYIKVFACILVVLGHFFQSMTKASVLPDNSLYQWFDTTIYYFHVPLFFICSGYLYQKYSRVDSIGAWKNNVIKKAVVLGIPYFVFSFAMGLLACSAVFMMLADCREVRCLNRFAKYTMPIFLMHTLFAAPCRVLLLKLGITNVPIQIGIGIAVSFIGPVVAMIILEKFKLDFLVYPGKVLKKKRI